MSIQNKIAVKLYLQRAIFALGMAIVIPVHSANLPDSQVLLQALGIDQKEIINLEQGETISFDVAEGKENELAAGVVMYVPASPSRIIQLIQKKGLAMVDSDLLAQGTIPAQATLDAFKGFGFKAGSEDAKDFLQAEPGSEFNLSFQEFQDLQEINSTQPR
jgi:hypothetical protein